MRTKAFQALRPVPALVSDVASPPYDVVDTAQAARLAEDNPNSFLHVIRSEIDLPDPSDLHSDAAYAKAAENFTRLQQNGVLVREDEPSVYVYRQQADAHEQTGIVTCCHIEDYETDVIRKHERTLKAKENDRARHIETLNANSGPVFMTYRDDPNIDALVATATTDEPLFDFAAPDGVHHIVWRVSGAAEIVVALESVNPCYIADGHHRSAAAAAVGSARRNANADHTGEEEYNWFLATLFPASQLRILSYNRLVHDLNGADPANFLDSVGERFSVAPTSNQEPLNPGSISMYLDGTWYELAWNVSSQSGCVAMLDLTVLQERLLAPILGIEDPRTSKRIGFVGGIHGTAELARSVDSGEHAVAFSVHPVTVEQLMAVSDAGEIMPPKSTWFEPKLRSGLFVHTI
jgi:uncharacterized protein (DUF1015 family)